MAATSSLPALATLLLLASPAVLAAQRVDELPPGTRVRVTAPQYSRDPYVGSLLGIAGDTLALDAEHGTSPLTLPLARVRRIEVSEGTKSKVVTGAAVGFGVGATASLLFLAGFCSGADTVCESDEWLRAFAFIALPPTLVGAGIGLMIRTERWRAVELAPRAAPGQFARWQVGLSLPF